MHMAPVVEVAFASSPLSTSPTWTDVTEYVEHGINITGRGKSDEVAANNQPAMCTVRLRNYDARFSPGNAASPYYPNVKKGKRLRVLLAHIDVNYVVDPTFEGTSAPTWDDTGATLTTDATRAHVGTKSLKIVWDGTTPATVFTTLYGLEKGQVYTASAWVWVNAGSGAVRLGVAGIATGTASSTTGAWQQLTYSFTATAPRHTLQLTPSSAPSNGHTVWLDEVQVNDGGTVTTFSATGLLLSPRYDGYINRWPIEWPGGGKLAVSVVTCTDIFKRLGQDDLRSFLEEEVLVDAPAAYYPMDEPSDSVTAGNEGSYPAGPMVIGQTGSGGTIAFGQGTGPGADGLSCPVFTPADALNGLYMAAQLGGQFEQASNVEFVTVEMWFSTTTVSRGLFVTYSNDLVNQLSLSLNASGYLVIGSVTLAGTTSHVVNATNLANDAVHHVIYTEQSKTVWIDGVAFGPVTVNYIRQLRHFQAGAVAGGNLWQGTVSHLAFYLGSTVTINTALAQRHYNAGANGFAGEMADARVKRIAAYSGIATADVATAGTLFGAISSQGPGRKTPLALMQEVEVTESAQLFARRDGGLMLQARDVRYNQPAAVTIDAADVEGQLSYIDDDQLVTNEVRASRPGGASISIRNATSIAAYGRKSQTMSLLKTSDAGVREAANWYLQRYADPPPRIRSLPVEAYTLGVAQCRAILAADISSVIALTGLPAQAPAATDTVCIEGYSETIGHKRIDFMFFTSPASLDRVWILDDAVLSVLDSTTVLSY